MRFLIDASMPRSAAVMLRGMGHDAVDVREVGMASAADQAVAAHARLNNQTLVTRDLDFADIRTYPPSDYPGIVVVRLPEHATANQVITVLEAFVERQDWLVSLQGRLVILEFGRVRLRPAD